MSELGLTRVPEELIEGSVGSLRSAAAQWRGRADAGDDLRVALRRLDPRQVWVNVDDNEIYADRFDEILSYWQDIAENLRSGASVLEEYADIVEWGQQEAQDALDVWDEAQRTTDRAYAAHQEQQARNAGALRASGGVRPDTWSAFTDPGEARRNDARAILHDARFGVSRVAQHAAARLHALADAAPVISRSRARGEAAHAAGAARFDMTLRLAYQLIVEPTAGWVADRTTDALTAIQVLVENPDIALELGAGALGFGGGSILTLGGVATSPTGVGAVGIAGGAGVASAGGATVVHAWGRWMNKINEQNPRYPDRNTAGEFRRRDDGKNPNTPDIEREKRGLDRVEKELGVPVLRKQYVAKIEGLYKHPDHPELGLRARKYDGLAKNNDGENTLTAIEIKRAGVSRSSNQRIFDEAAASGRYPTVKIDGVVYRITRVILRNEL